MTGPVSLSLAFCRFNRAYKRFSDIVIGTVFDPEKDVVLITGGCSGLGKELTKQFCSKNTFKIIILDIDIPKRQEDRMENVIYYKCDVSCREEVLQTSELIKKNIGNITVLINNAGITRGKPLIDLSFDDIEKTIKVNLLSSFYTIKAFLPGMMAANRGYIVTIASVLGYLSPARLSAYGASKSGLIALHESVTYELGPPSLSAHGVKTLLICPGQLKTKMFTGVRTPSSLFAPELEPCYVAKSVMRAIELGRRGEIKIPFYGNFIPMVRLLPWPIVEVIRGASSIDTSMNNFIGKLTVKDVFKSFSNASAIADEDSVGVSTK